MVFIMAKTCLKLMQNGSVLLCFVNWLLDRQASCSELCSMYCVVWRFCVVCFDTWDSFCMTGL